MAHRGPAQRPGAHRRAAVRHDLRRVRGRPARRGGQLTPEGGTGDVKYHHGAEGAYLTAKGKAITVTLAPNPSHLEFVAPGGRRPRARQADPAPRARRAARSHRRALPVVIHGDAAFAGQGVVAETLNLGALKGYRTGGTIHLITNNQVGFTTDTEDARSTRYASDLAKGFDIPIIHVNADDPEACLGAVRLAMAYRRAVPAGRADRPGGLPPPRAQRGRRAGVHPAADVRADQGTARRCGSMYAGRCEAEGVMTQDEADAQARGGVPARWSRSSRRSRRALAQDRASPRRRPSRWSPGRKSMTRGRAAELLTALNEQLLTLARGLHGATRSCAKQLERRRAGAGPRGRHRLGPRRGARASRSLLTEGVPIRLTGQDAERGTFSQRHLVLHDANTGEHLARRSSSCPAPWRRSSCTTARCPSSPSLGFEYGYSAAAPEALVLWEAQFGDFVNGAQVIIDQFLSAGLSKWGLTTRLTLLLPHGYEGQGPEHSSARLERFLQLARRGQHPGRQLHHAGAVLPPAAPPGAAHPRSARSSIMTPKSLLRLPQASSTLDDLAEGRFQPVLDDPCGRRAPRARSRGWCCAAARSTTTCWRRPRSSWRRAPALVRLEQLYSFPWTEMREVLARYPQRSGSWSGRRRSRGTWAPGPISSPSCAELLPAGVDAALRRAPRAGQPGRGLSRGSRAGAEPHRHARRWSRGARGDRWTTGNTERAIRVGIALRFSSWPASRLA